VGLAERWTVQEVATRDEGQYSEEENALLKQEDDSLHSDGTALNTIAELA
jgi:hypothetical protein